MPRRRTSAGRCRLKKRFMQANLTAVELTGTVNNLRQLELDADLPSDVAAKVRVIVLYSPNSDDLDEREWRQAAARNPAFEFLDDEAEDIYTLKDGKQIADEV